VRNNRVATQFSSDYQPYGANYQASGSEAFQYTDRMSDPVTGLYYFNARFYDPATMRFTTTDPYGGSRTEPSTLNQHSYAGNNPLSNTDPTGLNALTDFWNWMSNGWNSLPNWLQIGIIATGAFALTLGLCVTIIGCFAAGGVDTTTLAELPSLVSSTPAEEDLGEAIPSLSRAGVSLASFTSDLTPRQVFGFGGEEFIDAQTGDINNGMMADFLGLAEKINTGFSNIEPDSLDYSLGEPPVIGGVKVGTTLTWSEIWEWASAIFNGNARPGILYFLTSPSTGEIGPSWIKEMTLRALGFSIVKIEGPWWIEPS
jgi:RHS repeat-associated protein